MANYLNKKKLCMGEVSWKKYASKEIWSMLETKMGKCQVQLSAISASIVNLYFGKNSFCSLGQIDVKSKYKL